MKIFLMFYGIFIITTFIFSIGDFYGICHTPKDIYESNNCNIFGATCLFLILLILDPLFYISVFLFWVFHIGRKN